MSVLYLFFDCTFWVKVEIYRQDELDISDGLSAKYGYLIGGIQEKLGALMCQLQIRIIVTKIFIHICKPCQNLIDVAAFI